MKNIIIGTAGHIDHGKTTLTKLLQEEIRPLGRRTEERNHHRSWIYIF